MLYQTIKSDMVSAQKSGDSRLLGALRLIVSELSYAQVDHKDGELPDEDVVKVLFKEAKKRKESMDIYEKAGALDRVEQERYELGIITRYLPEMMAEKDVEVEVDKIAAETGLVGGRLMGAVMGRLKGKAEGAVINKIVNEKYKG